MQKTKIVIQTTINFLLKNISLLGENLSFQAATKELKEKMRSGKVKTKGRFTSDTVNEMLKKFPQPPHTIFPKQM